MEIKLYNLWNIWLVTIFGQFLLKMFAENARDQKLLLLIFYEKTYLKGSVASVFTLNRKGLAWDITGPGMEYRFFS